jgi:hypothetical protein
MNDIAMKSQHTLPAISIALLLAATSIPVRAAELDFDLVLHPGPASHEGNSVALDGQGNIYLTGQMNANRFQDGQLYADILGTNFVVSQAQEYFLVKYGPQGQPLWVVTAGGSQADHGNCVRVAPNDEPVVVLTFTGTNFHGAEVPNAGLQDFALARYSASGDLLWVNVAGGAGRDAAFDLDFDSQGDIYIVGRVDGEVTIGGQALGQRFQNTGYLAKYGASGQFRWVKALGLIRGDVGLDIDSSDNIYITGNSSGKIASLSGDGVFVAKYDLEGNNLWTRIFPANSSDGGTGIVATEEGLFVAGTFTSDMFTLGDATLTSANRQLRGFVARFSLAGDPIWARQVGGRAYAVAVGRDQSVYTGGFYSANSPTVAGQTPELLGSNEAYLASFSAGGELQTLDTWRSIDGDIVRDVVAANDGHLYLSGEIPASVVGDPSGQGRAFVGRVQLDSGTAPAGPQLTVRRDGGDLLLSWPADTVDAVLEAATQLGQAFAPLAFEPAPGQPNSARIAIGGESQFIRLQTTEP